MAGIYGISAYQQATQSWKAQSAEVKNQAVPSKTEHAASPKEGNTKVETKPFMPISSNSSLVPQKTEYGNTIGDVKLSDKAKEYYEKLKSKYHNVEFIAVSKDMKGKVQQNAAAYGNANKMVVLIDDEKLERMAEDESYQKKYEGIIAMSQTKLSEAKNSLMSTGANVKNFGMSVDSDGNESFFATVEKSLDMQKKRIEKKAAEKVKERAQEKKKAEKDLRDEQIEKVRENKAEKTKGEEESDGEKIDDKEYVTFEAKSWDELFDKVRAYSYDDANARVMTDAERMLGAQVDYKG